MQYCPSNHTPYDDEPDTIEEAEKFLKQHKEGRLSLSSMRDLDWAATIIQYLLDDMEAEGII
jgi:hypothetical protein